ncbi:MAG: MarR family winged helix-turn-helix transcriptional regulator [Acidimicrobiales bacterium]
MVFRTRGLERATHQVGVYLQEALRDLALTQAEVHVLAHLATEGPATVGELHAGFGHRRSTLTSVLDRLETRGLASRSVNPADGRSIVVTLTASGATVADRARVVIEDLERRVAEATSPAEQSGFLAVLDAIEHATEVP